MEAAAANNAGERRKPAAPMYADVPLKKEERRMNVSNELKDKINFGSFKVEAGVDLLHLPKFERFQRKRRLMQLLRSNPSIVSVQRPSFKYLRSNSRSRRRME
jgi:hypothetical protein